MLQRKTNDNSSNWLRIPDHPYRILVTRGSGLGKSNALLNLEKQKDDDNYDDGCY